MVSLSRPLPGQVRPGRIKDETAIRGITDEVFSVFGEYGSWLPGYLSHPGVWTFVYEENRGLCGYTMLGLIEPDERGGARMADLLALAVGRADQGQGIGTALLIHVIHKARMLKRTMNMVEVRLTVAEDNDVARQLFDRFGFTPIPGNHGCYDQGQRALRLGWKI